MLLDDVRKVDNDLGDFEHGSSRLRRDALILVENNSLTASRCKTASKLDSCCSSVASCLLRVRLKNSDF